MLHDGRVVNRKGPGSTVYSGALVQFWAVPVVFLHRRSESVTYAQIGNYPFGSMSKPQEDLVGILPTPPHVDLKEDPTD